MSRESVGTRESPDRAEVHSTTVRVIERLRKNSEIVAEWERFVGGFIVGEHNPKIRDAFLRHPDVRLYEEMKQIASETQ